jgi:transposase
MTPNVLKKHIIPNERNIRQSVKGLLTKDTWYNKARYKMLEKNMNIQGKMIVTTLEELMPQEYFLRDLSALVDFSFICEKIEHLYSHVGRPSIDPVVLVKMLLIGFLYGIDSERRIEKEVQVNIAYRWFLGIDLDARVPDHSTISQTRRRKFNSTNIFEEIFAEIVKKCIEAGLVDGSLILTDSTHIKASASMKRKETVTVKVEPSEKS